MERRLPYVCLVAGMTNTFRWIQELRKRQNAQYPVVRTITDKYRQVVSGNISFVSLDRGILSKPPYQIPMFHIYAAYLVNFESAIDFIRKALESRSDIFGIYLRVSCRSMKGMTVK
jgi:hypothetical protein